MMELVPTPKRDSNSKSKERIQKINIDALKLQQDHKNSITLKTNKVKVLRNKMSIIPVHANQKSNDLVSVIESNSIRSKSSLSSRPILLSKLTINNKTSRSGVLSNNLNHSYINLTYGSNHN